MPPVLTQADVYTRWRMLMGELGFSKSLLWVAMFDSEGRMLPTLSQVDELPAAPDDQFLESLMDAFGQVLHRFAPGGRIAFLLSRPGRAGITAFDRVWATGLDIAARKHGVDAHLVHLANDEEVRVFALDDLISS